MKKFSLRIEYFCLVFHSKKLRILKTRLTFIREHTLIFSPIISLFFIPYFKLKPHYFLKIMNEKSFITFKKKMKLLINNLLKDAGNFAYQMKGFLSC